MKGLFPEEQIRNKAADAPWKKKETDKMLDRYFEGTTYKRLAALLGRNPKAIVRRIQVFLYNEEDRVLRYQPKRRISRKGKRLTENEQCLIKAHRERDIPAKETAKVLQRDVAEFSDEWKRKADFKSMKFASSLELVMALRFAYHFHKREVVPNKIYDDLKAEEIEFGAGEAALADKFCPPHIRTLALFLIEKYDEEKFRRELKKKPK